MSTTCCYICCSGPKLGLPCGRPAKPDDPDNYCELCAARRDLINLANTDGSPCRNTYNYLNSSTCVTGEQRRLAVYGGFCLECLSMME